MKQPSLDELMRKVDSRYTLVVMAAKRARLLTEGGGSEANGAKPVTKALEEIAKGKVKFRHTKQGRK